MKFTLLLLIVVSFSSKAQIINQHMHKAALELSQLIPIISDENAFKDEKNEKIFLDSLTNLENIFKNIKKHPRVQGQGFSLSREMIVRELAETRQLFKGPKKNFALYKFNSSLGLCISCHAQVSKKDELKIFHDINVDTLNLSDFAKGEYLFLTREFEKSMTFYDAYIRSFSGKDDIASLQNALNRKLTYYTRIKSDRETAKNSFIEDTKNSKLPTTIKEQILSWSEALGKKRDWANFNAKMASEKEMKEFIEKHVKPIESESPVVNLFSYAEVDDLEISKILFDYLNHNPKSPITGEILLWLAKIDKKLNYNIFYSLGDNYLRTCMENFKHKPIAKECFNEYRDGIIFSYTGSAGTSLPLEVEKELKKYQKMLKIK